jgi:hypothetical protein
MILIDVLGMVFLPYLYWNRWVVIEELSAQDIHNSGQRPAGLACQPGGSRLENQE